MNPTRVRKASVHSFLCTIAPISAMATQSEQSGAQLWQLRLLRDSIIGSRTRKGQIVSEGKVPELISYIRRPAHDAEALEMRSLAAIIVGSLAHSASPPTLLALLRGGAPAALLSAMADLTLLADSLPSAETQAPLKMLETFMRSLRALMTALADEISPNSRFGLGSGKQWSQDGGSDLQPYRAKSHREPSGWDIANAGFASPAMGRSADGDSHMASASSSDLRSRYTASAQSSSPLTPRQELTLLARDAISELYSPEHLPLLLGPLFLAPIPRDDRSDVTFKQAREASHTRNHSSGVVQPSPSSNMSVDEPASPVATIATALDASPSQPAIPLDVKTRIHAIVEMACAILSVSLNIPGPGPSTKATHEASPAEEIAARRASVVDFRSRKSPFFAWAMPSSDGQSESSRDASRDRKRDGEVALPPRHPGEIARGVLEVLLEAAECGMPKAQEASLWALAELTQNNADVSGKLFKCHTPSGLLPTTMLLSMRNEPSPPIRMAAFFCLSHIVKVHPFTRKTNERVLATLIGLLDISGDIQVTAALALARVVTDDTDLQVVACEAGFDSLKKLGLLLKSACKDLSASGKQRQGVPKPDHPAHRLREAVLTALAALTFSKDELRRQFVNHEQPALIPLVAPLITSGAVGTRIAACRLIRALSRSISILRTSLVDAGVGEQLVKILQNDDEHLDVKVEAVATICNLVLSFSPMRTYLLQNGAIPRIVDLCRSTDGCMRLNALWAIKNTIFASDLEFKKTVMDQLSFTYLKDLATGREPTSDDENSSLQEQALNIIRNLASNRSEDVTMTITGFGGEDAFFTMLEEVIWQRENALLIEQASYILVNVTVEADRYRKVVLGRPNIIDALRFFLSHQRNQIRVAGIMVGMHLTQPLAGKEADDDNTAAGAIDPSLTTGLSASAEAAIREPPHIEAISILKNFGYTQCLITASEYGDRDVTDRAKVLLSRFQVVED